MPAYNEAYWEGRAARGEVAPWGRWLDLEHGIVLRWALWRAWPRGVRRVVDVGCGAGRWSSWMARRFGCQVLGTDQFDWSGRPPGLPFVKQDAEMLDACGEIRAWGPDLATSINALTCMTDWRKAVAAHCRVAPRVLAFDNFQTPTPEWRQSLVHRQPIEVPELVAAFEQQGFVLRRAVAGDVMHRRLFVATPRWLAPAVMALSAAIDVTVSLAVSPRRARHSALLFERRQG